MFIAVRTGTRGRFWVGQLVPGQGRAAGRFSCVRLVQLRSVASGRVQSVQLRSVAFGWAQSVWLGSGAFGRILAWMGGAEVSKRYFDVIFSK